MFWNKKPVAVLASLLFIHLLAHIDRNMLLGFSPQIIRDLSLSNAQYGFLAGGVWVISFGVMAVVMGTLADRHSRTRVMAAGVLIWSICTWASGHAQSFEQLALARFFVASGEAALVPAAVSLLAELFAEKRRSTAMGVFFMGIPLGVGCAFLLAGTFGAAHGWRSTFHVLGIIGIFIAAGLAFLKDKRSHADVASRQDDKSPLHQVRVVLQVLRRQRALRHLLTGFVLVHFYFTGLSFLQLWAVGERGMTAAAMATRIGALEIVFGVLGSVAGGVLGDGAARRLRGSHASVMALLVLACAAPMIACRFAAPGSAVFYVGLCAGFFLPLALYGPCNAAIMKAVPEDARSTITGFSMLCINLFAITAGNLAAGWAIDILKSRGAASPLTMVLLATDVVALSSLIFFALAARITSSESAPSSGRVQHAL